MTTKTAGCCTKCDAEVFDVVERDPDTRIPTRIGQPHADAMRLNFYLADGTRMDLTFCKSCAEGLTPDDYPHLWQRVMHSWVAQSGPDHPGGAKAHVNNAILGLVNAKPWTEVR